MFSHSLNNNRVYSQAQICFRVRCSSYPFDTVRLALKPVNYSICILQLNGFDIHLKDLSDIHDCIVEPSMFSQNVCTCVVMILHRRSEILGD